MRKFEDTRQAISSPADVKSVNIILPDHLPVSGSAIVVLAIDSYPSTSLTITDGPGLE